MDPQKLVEMLQGTIHPDTRELAEKQLNEVHKIIQFSPTLLFTVMEDKHPFPVRQAGVIYLKNMIMQFWAQRVPETPIEQAPFCIHENDKAFIRENIIKAMINSPELIRVQLAVCLSTILKNDYPGKWDNVVSVMVQYLSMDDATVWYGALVAIYQLVKNHEYKKPEEREPLDKAMVDILPLMYQRIVQLLPDASEPSVLLQKLILKVFHALVQFHLSMNVINQGVFSQWMAVFQIIADRPVPPETEQVDIEDRPELSWWKVKKWALNILSRVFDRYGNPGSVVKQYVQFSDWYLKTFSDGILKALLKILNQFRQSQYVSPRVLQQSLNYINTAYTVSKDTNVMIVAAAVKCLAGLGNGLKKKFSPYAPLCIQAFLEKFKEKKVMVVTALRDGIDAAFPATTFTNIMEDVLAALDNKNPSIKAETCSFIARSFRVSSASSLTKAVLKPLCATLVLKLSDTTPDVREAAMQALGTALRIVGDKPMNTFLADLEKIKLDKIKEYCDKVELPEGKGGAKKPKPKKEKAPEEPPARPKTASASTGGDKKKVVRGKKPAAKGGEAKKAAPKAAKGTAGAKKGAKKGGSKDTAASIPTETVLGDEEALEKASACLPKSVVDTLTSSNWKERLAAMEEFTQAVHNMERADVPGQAFVRFMARPPGFKDANFQVMNAKFAMVAILAEKSNFSLTSAEFVCKFLVDKISDIKAGAKVKEALTAIGEAVSGQSPPKPFRGLKKGGAGETEEDDEEGGAPGGGAMQDLIPREDISGKITEGLLGELNDPKWKVRGEALEKVMNAKFAMVAILAEKSNFSLTSAEFVCKFLVDKISDIKAGAKVKEALTAIGEAVTLGVISETAVRYAFDSQKNPKNQAEIINWLSQAIQEFGFSTIKPKLFIKYVKTALSATNPQIRTASVTCIGVMYMYMGANLRMLFEDLKPAQLSLIDAEIEKVSGQSPPKPFRGLKKGGAGETEESDEDEDEDDEEGGAPGGGGAMQDLIPREDISGKITEGLLGELNDPKWKVRGEALEKVQTILKEAKFISPDLGDLPAALRTRLGESNKILATTTATICQTIAVAMGPPVKAHVKTVVPGLMMLTADNKIAVRQASVLAMTAWEEQVGLAPFIEDEMLSSALAKEKPFLKMEIFGWLTEKLVKYRTLPAELGQSVQYLFSALEDRNADVRKKAQEALPPFMMHLTYEKMVKMTGKLKPASKTQIMGILEKQRANIPEKPGKPEKAGKKPKARAAAAAAEPEDEPEEPEPAPPPTKKSSKRPKTAPSKSSSPPKEEAAAGRVSSPDSSENAPPPSNRRGKGKDAGNSKKLSSKSKKGEEEDTGPPLLIVGSKEKRIKDEHDLKVLKWNFTSSRSEYVDQLKEQMQPCFSRSLIQNLYQDDFKYHVLALTVLTNCIENHKDATIANLDLILKWLTLRFTETNTTVNVKSIDYLQQLFTMLGESDYGLSDHEANAFIPSLIAKVGDNKENIRKGVRKVMKLSLKLYPASKMFVFIIEGLKSKNSRQRTECLDELGSMIELYGLNVCQPSPPKALKEIASQIADRDNPVRSAALNALVQAYQILGEDIYKQVGRLNDKDMALLEERIKRSGKKPAIATKAAQPVQNKKNDKASRADNKKAPPARPSTAPEQAAPAQPPSDQSVPGCFSLDLDKLGLDRASTELALPKLVDTSYVSELLDYEVKLPARTKPTKQSKPSEVQLNFMMSQVASTDLNLSIQAQAQLDEILKDRERCKVMTGHIDQLLVATAFQLRMAFSRHMGDEESSKNVIRMYRCLVALLVSLFQNTQLCKEASKHLLCDLVNNLITVLIDDRLMSFEDGPQVVRSVNVLMGLVVENSDHSNVIGALLKLLHECVASETHSKFSQLVMKCLWRKVRMMPSFIKDLQVEKIMVDMHNFLKAFPSPTWKGKTTDTPLRTVKTMLHSLAKILGSKVFMYLSEIPDLQESELEGYLKKVLRTSQRSSTGHSNEHVNGSEPEGNILQSHAGDKNRRPPGKTNDVLAEIFKKIGSKENTREGLAELYDFKQKYPGVNIDPFLKKTSNFFQSYIERGLKTITLEREAESGKSSSSDTTPVITPTPDSADVGDFESGDQANYLERIRVLRARCGMDNNNPEEAPNGGSKQPVRVANDPPSTDPDPESNDTNAPPGLYQPHRITLGSSSNLIQNTETAPSVPDNMDDLKKRLERIKNQSK